MVKIEFSGDWREYFGSIDLKTVDDFFTFSSGETVNRNSKRQVLAFSLGEGGDKREFYIKRFFKPHYKDSLFALLNHGRMLSQGQVEWENAGILLENGIQPYPPVCYGYESGLGIEKRSFFVTEKLTSQCMTDFIKEKFPSMDVEEKNRVIIELARLVRRLHEAGISMPDLYVWHVYIDKNAAGEYEFALIDLHRMQKGVNFQRRVRNLAALFFSMLEEYFSDEDKRLFLEEYGFLTPKKLLPKIQSRLKTLRQRRSDPKWAWR